MSLIRTTSAAHETSLAAREILLWTTKDGREIPLDDMSDEHIANAVRVLTLWRQRLKKRGSDEPIVAKLAQAIACFKQIERRRRKAARTETPPGTSEKPHYSSFGSRAMRPRKRVAST